MSFENHFVEVTAVFMMKTKKQLQKTGALGNFPAKYLNKTCFNT